MNPSTKSPSRKPCALKEAGVATEVVAVSHGVGACQETLRTAMAIGADRGILVETDVEPAAAGRRQAAQGLATRTAQLVICGKQAIDDDANQTGQMLAALARLAPGHLRLQGRSADGKATVTREIDGGLETIEIDPAGGGDHRPAPQRAALRHAAQHHEGQEEAARHRQAGRSGRRCRRRA